MQISPINSNYQTRNQFHKNTPKFEGVLNKVQLNFILERLSRRNTKVFEKFNIDDFKGVINSLIKKYECLGTSSVGIQIVNNDDLPKLLGKNFANYDTKNKMGLCIAVGNRKGPIEDMTNIYEAQTFLINPAQLSKL